MEEGFSFFYLSPRRVGIFVGEGWGEYRRCFKNLVPNLGVWILDILWKCLPMVTVLFSCLEEVPQAWFNHRPGHFQSHAKRGSARALQVDVP